MRMKILRKFIDWKTTGTNLYRLRSDNASLRRYVCSAHRKNTDRCTNDSYDCDSCTNVHMDKNISRLELAQVFGVSENVINNWESGRTAIGIEDLLFYCQIANVTLDDILVYQK